MSVALASPALEQAAEWFALRQQGWSDGDQEAFCRLLTRFNEEIVARQNRLAQSGAPGTDPAES